MYSDEYSNEEINQNYDENENVDNSSNINNNDSSSKKMLWIVIAAIILVLIVILYLWLGSGDKPDAPVTITPQITISSQKENLSLGNSLPLKAIVANVENATIVWTSSNEAVATVDNMGNVTSVNTGVAIITATYTHTDNRPYSISCEVTVINGDPNVPLTNVSFPEGEVLISVGAKFQMQVVIEPTNAYVADIEYSSADESIVIVDKTTGVIKALKEGTANIRLNVNDGDFTDQITINVTKKQGISQFFIPVDSIKFDKPSLKLVVGSNPISLSYKILPENDLSDNLDWESSDPTVASVNEGIVSPLKVGTTKITVTSLDGKNATIEIEVVKENVAVTGIEILNNSTTDTNYTEKTKIFNLKVNETAKILAGVKPDDATNKDISYSSSNKAVATVDEYGFITAVSKGTAKITLVSKENNSVKAEITVNVTSSGGNDGPGSGSNAGTLSVLPENIKIAPGATTKIHVTTSGTSITRCYSNKVAIASISEKTDTYCTIKGVNSGETTVTIVAGNLSATVNVEVSENSVTKIEISDSSWSAKMGETKKVNVTLTPSNSSSTIVAVSDKPSIATVSCSGTSCDIKANGPGTAIITIYPKDNYGLAKIVNVNVLSSSESDKKCTDWSDPVITTSDEEVDNEGSEDCATCTIWKKSVMKFKYSYSYSCVDTEDPSREIIDKKISEDGFVDGTSVGTAARAAYDQSKNWCENTLKGTFESSLDKVSIKEYYEVTTRTRTCN